MVDKILNFETILNARFLTLSSNKLPISQRITTHKVTSKRYKNRINNLTYELKRLHNYWLKCRRSKVEGFYTE